MCTRYSPAVGNVAWTVYTPGVPVGSGWMWAKVPRSVRVMIMCIHTWWVRTRSPTRSPVSASRTSTVSWVGWPGSMAAGAMRFTVRPASVGVTGAMSASSMTLIAGRIGMPMPSDQDRTPFMPRSAWSVRLAQVNTDPSARATTATATR